EEDVAARSERKRGRRLASSGGSDEDRPLSEHPERRRVEKDGVGADAQQPPEQIPHDTALPFRAESKQAVAVAEGQSGWVGAAEGKANPPRFVHRKLVEMTI